MSPWVTKRPASSDTIRCITIVSRESLWYATTSPTEYESAEPSTTRSPVWNSGLHAGAVRVTYVVPPPSDEGQKSHTVASTSAARALMLAALVAVVMVSTPSSGAGQGGRSTALPARRKGYSAYREGDALGKVAISPCLGDGTGA